mgnify:FL=1|tara:strand:- start:691 stop:1293 length:603 start_codon:yes stop_codon:yes gene_type:complete
MRKELFPISIFHGKVEDNGKLKDNILPFIQTTKQYNKPPEGWLTNNINTSYNNTEINCYDFLIEETQQQYQAVLNTFFDERFNINVSQMWYNVYNGGEWQEEHTHTGTIGSPIHFACIHFLSFDPNIHTPVTFIDPLITTRALSLEMKSNGYNDKVNLKYEEGDLIMFPSYLSHEVSPSIQSDYPRITISFNIEVLNYAS